MEGVTSHLPRVAGCPGVAVHVDSPCVEPAILSYKIVHYMYSP